MGSDRQSQSRDKTVAITGATGFIGRTTAKAFLADGWSTVGITRSSSRSASLPLGCYLQVADINDVQTLSKAFADTRVIVHAASDTSGTREGALRTTLGGTLSVLQAAANAAVERIVYLSSCSVYHYPPTTEGSVLDEAAAIEPRPETRGTYTWAKVLAEQKAIAAAASLGVPLVVLRPGIVYGPDEAGTNAMVAIRVPPFGLCMIGSPQQIVPVVHVDDVAQAIVRAASHERAIGETFNIVHPDRVTKREFADSWIKPSYGTRTLPRLPLGLLIAGVTIENALSRAFRRRPLLTQYRLRSSQRSVAISSNKATEVVGWRPKWPITSSNEEPPMQAKGQRSACAG